MRKILYALGSLLLSAAAAVSLFGSSSVTVGAAAEELSVSIPVTQTVDNNGDGAVGNIEIFYFLTAEDSNAPLPEGAENNVFDFSLLNSDAYDLEMTYEAPGDYYYRLKGSGDDLSEYNVNTDEYRILVSVRNSADGLTSQIIAYNEKNEKTNIVFPYTLKTVTDAETNVRDEESIPDEPESSEPSDGNSEPSDYEKPSETDPVPFDTDTIPDEPYEIHEESEFLPTGSVVPEKSRKPHDAPTTAAGASYTQPETPLTGDQVFSVVLMLIAAVSGGIIFIFKIKEKKEK